MIFDIKIWGPFPVNLQNFQTQLNIYVETLGKSDETLRNGTAKNTVISLNFLGWKFCGKAQFTHSFGRIVPNYGETVPFHKISTPEN